MDTYTVLTVTSNTIIHEGISSVLQQDKRFVILGTVTKYSTLADEILSYEPDIVLIHTDNPSISYTRHIIETISNINKEIKIFILTSNTSLEIIRISLFTNINEILTTSLKPENLRQDILDSIQDNLLLIKKHKNSNRNDVTPQNTINSILSCREIEILEKVGIGKNNLQISHELDITYDTVRSHLKHIYEKLSIKNRAMLISFVLQSDINKDNWIT